MTFNLTLKVKVLIKKWLFFLNHLLSFIIITHYKRIYYIDNKSRVYTEARNKIDVRLRPQFPIINLTLIVLLLLVSQKNYYYYFYSFHYYYHYWPIVREENWERKKKKKKKKKKKVHFSLSFSCSIPFSCLVLSKVKEPQIRSQFSVNNCRYFHQ